MEQLPETALASLSSDANKQVFNSLARTSKALSERVNELTEGNYQWKLMTEAYLKTEIALENNNWKSVYKFVTLIDKSRFLLFARDVFYAELGLLIRVPVASYLKIVVEKALLETVKFLLDLPQLEHTWEDPKVHTSSYEILQR